MADVQWTRADEGTDRERMVAERGGRRLAVWYDADGEGWAYAVYREDEGGHYREVDGGPLDAEEEGAACEEATHAASWRRA